MARPKKIPKAKEPITIRYKDLKNGNQSIYLDCYVNGERSYEFLKMYLVPEVNDAAKAQNQNTLRAAIQIKNDRITEINNGKARIDTENKFSKLLLTDWIEDFFNRKKDQLSKGRITQIKAVKRLVLEYRGSNVTMAQIDKNYCEGFISFLRKAKTRYGKDYKESTKWNLYATFVAIMIDAEKNKVISSAPCREIDSHDKIKLPSSTRSYLTIDELKKMIATDCPRFDIKQAFLFGCFCGLRYSDIEKLTWGDVYQDGQRWRANVTMKKTKKPIVISLSDDARKWMPERNSKEDKDKIFSLPSVRYISEVMKKWGKLSGIKKDICFHTSRHTFATMMLTLGADLYTVSKMLGHTNIKMTQIYAEIVNPKKDEAVDLVKGIF